MSKKAKLSLSNLDVQSFVTTENKLNGGAGTWQCGTDDPIKCPDGTLYYVCGTGQTVFLCRTKNMCGESYLNPCIPETRGGLDCPQPF